MASRPYEEERGILRVGARREMDRAVAAEIAELVRSKQRQGRPCVLGLATGHTPTGIYRELVRLHRDEGLSFAGVTTFNLDEYVGLGPRDPGSFRRWMDQVLFDHVDLAPERIHLPRGDVPAEGLDAECARYETLLREAGGVDVQLLGVGRNGHVAFNEPGSAPDSRTRVVALTDHTRQVNARDFPRGARVPTHAITMGLGTIAEARRLRVVAFGAPKAEAVGYLLRGDRDPRWPCSFVRTHPDLRVFCDHGAAAGVGPRRRHE